MYSEAALAHDDGATAPVADAEAPVTNVANPASASGDARKRRGPAFFAPLRGASFRRLLLGQTVSRFGDQFYFVAIPWLVLRAGGFLRVVVVHGRGRIAEKDRACPVRSTDRRFFATVNIPGGHDGLGTGVTYSCFASDTIAPAILRTDCAAPQDFPRGGCPFC